MEDRDKPAVWRTRARMASPASIITETGMGMATVTGTGMETATGTAIVMIGRIIITAVMPRIMDGTPASGIPVSELVSAAISVMGLAMDMAITVMVPSMELIQAGVISG